MVSIKMNLLCHVQQRYLSGYVTKKAINTIAIRSPLHPTISPCLILHKAPRIQHTNKKIQATATISTARQQRAPLDTKYIISVIFQQKKRLAIAFLALTICVASNLTSPVLSGMLFETLVKGMPFDAYKQLLAVMVTIYIIEPLLSDVYIRYICAVGEAVQATLRKEAFRVLLMQRMEFYDKHRASELTALLSKDLDLVRTFFFGNVSRDRGLRALFEALGSVLVLFFMSWRLGPVLGAVIIATASIAWIYRRESRKFEQASATAHSRMAMAIDETVSQVRTVRLFAGEAYERERFGLHVVEAFSTGLGFARAKALLECLNRGAVHLSLLFLYGLGGYLVNTGLMPIRTLLSAVGFTFSLIFATQGLLQTWTDARQTMAAVSRVQRILGESPVDPSMASALPPGAWWDFANEIEGSCSIDYDGSSLPYTPSLAGKGVEDAAVGGGVKGSVTAAEAARHGDLLLSEISFSYPARPGVGVIKDLTLTVPRGKVTAIVGRSGAGKSTVAALIERLYAPEKGSILLDDIPIELFSRKEWVEAVTAVTQEPVLFSGSIFDNIAYGKPYATAEDVERASRAANAHDFIMALPQGYSSVVGDRGMLLSGGQRQRIALARALLRDAPILILDEATSALDAESERLVQSAIDRLVADRTVIVIAHRLSTVQAADQIVVMDNGAVVEKGTHEELVGLGGRYKSLVSSQALTLSASV